MLLYLFFDSLLSTCAKKMETEKWPKAADFPYLYEYQIFFCNKIPYSFFSIILNKVNKTFKKS